MIIIRSDRLLDWYSKLSSKVHGRGIRVKGLSAFIFIIIRDKTWLHTDKPDVILKHEKIHFWQQVEMLFIGQWIMYSYYYIKNLYSGMTSYAAYWYNPFEQEARMAGVEGYYENRQPYSWITHAHS